MSTKISLDQWQALIAVVDEGGYAAAAEALGKSQSAISYAVQKIETELGIRAFTLEGRRAKLTETGDMLYRQAKLLLEEAGRIENSAIQSSHGWEPLVRLAADALFPRQQALCALVTLAEESPLTRVEFQETVLSGSEEALLRHEADVVVTGRVPPGFMGDHLMRVRFIAVAAPDHPLHQKGELSLEDLRAHRQLVIRDSGKRRLDSGWLGAEQRWTFSYGGSRREALLRGLGFAWAPETEVEEDLEAGSLKPLPLKEGEERYGDLYLVYADGQYAGRAARFLGESLKASCRNPDTDP
ncbi:putative transcriptional regulator [Alloalcanivorax dieselolei B5]|uniref:Putative transcriptional regulator n=1 Tax=Alcanivorax dieselolei (strain DSM 16502 / CGMCC 1.3690 / MCCC 1A00001 / B-5) TaxID=930169 RepID=K0C9J4_ALCDB|nr:LysR family transcriptional regulator [Alloalcanivorax dieselolei]AFT68372.1 putative transcriptional regulator [Alloalcanivorax dieselolei B5]GGJ80698.1 transcriptional regulator [Alloalcanivorax dieselolei]